VRSKPVRSARLRSPEFAPKARRLQETPAATPKTSLVSAWAAAKRRLAEAGVESPVIDSRQLVEAAAGARRADMIGDPHRALTHDQLDALEAMLVRRERREPVGQILGRKGFWKIVLAVTPAVLSPRPETETILDVVLARFGEHQAFSVLDLGVGSGALLLAVLSERPSASGLGVDISEDALAVARANIANLGLTGRATLLRGDWALGVAPESFDLVLSNPPYIPTLEIECLQPEVRIHEPRIAIDGGVDGLAAYRRLAGEILGVLRPRGFFAVEIGAGQAAAVVALFADAGAAALETHNDLAGHERVVSGEKALGD